MYEKDLKFDKKWNLIFLEKPNKSLLRYLGAT